MDSNDQLKKLRESQKKMLDENSVFWDFIKSNKPFWNLFADAQTRTDMDIKISNLKKPAPSLAESNAAKIRLLSYISVGDGVHVHPHVHPDCFAEITRSNESNTNNDVRNGEKIMHSNKKLIDANNALQNAYSCINYVKNEIKNGSIAVDLKSIIIMTSKISEGIRSIQAIIDEVKEWADDQNNAEPTGFKTASDLANAMVEGDVFTLKENRNVRIYFDVSVDPSNPFKSINYDTGSSYIMGDIFRAPMVNYLRVINNG